MPLYAVMSRDPNPELATAVETLFPAELHYKFNETTWIVSGAGTAKDVSDLLGIKRDGLSGAVVFMLTHSYYGVTQTTFWDWIKSSIESDRHG
jgi:hypothetical protein